MKQFLTAVFSLYLLFVFCGCQANVFESYTAPTTSFQSTYSSHTGSNYEALILGKWFFADESYDEDEHYIVFYSDGTVEQKYGDRKMFSRYIIDGDLVTIKSGDGDEYGSMRITSINNNDLYAIDLSANSANEQNIHLTR